MDLPAFALHAEPLRRKFYRPKSVYCVHSRNRLLAFEGRCVFGVDCMCSKWASARLALGLAGTFKFYSSQIGVSAFYSAH